ncbi:YfhO family protein [Streptomyces sp. NPDC048604]|uniref:YfhO family protein n=1 Tax=Streptomyces sp. NPDC048604 TaxID=3365578 RepID=UPI0037123880
MSSALQTAPAPTDPAADEGSPPRPGGRTRLWGALAGGGLTCVVLCLAGILARTYPFGPVTRNIVDLGQQYLPYHAHWRRFLLGDADGDLFVNWHSGFGSNFLGDLGTYLSSPFDLMVVLFPADRIELALYVITAAKITAAGAAMTVLLLTLRRGPWPVAAVLGAAYALSGWTFSYGATVPMWLDGLLAFPLLCLVGEWARRGRRPVLGPLVVALAWTANFYTAYMATLGAAVFLAVRLLTADEGARRRLAGLLRASRSVLIGIGLAAPLVAVIFFATRVADPTPPTAFAAAAWTDVFARLLPATSSVATPALYIGTAALALALTLPFNTAVPRRERLAWTAAVVLVALSLQWEPTHLLWHAGASPNGIPYRQTFVLCGLLVLAGWLSTARGLPRLPAPAGGAVLLAALALAARDSVDIDRRTFPALGAAAALAVLAAACAVLASRRAAGRLLPVLAVALLVAAQAGEAAVTGARIEREQLSKVSWAPRLGPWHDEVAAAVARADDWPKRRTDPGETPGGNDVLITGGQGADYYSSLTSRVYSQTVSALGFGSYAKGRHPVTLDSPVADAIFSVGARIRSTPTAPVREDALPEADVTTVERTVPPLVTVHPGPVDTLRYGDSAFANQELALGADVYDLPAGGRRTADGKTVTLTGSCPAGSDVWFWAPDHTGTATLDGRPPAHFDGKPPSVRAPMQSLGAVPPSGAVRVVVHAAKTAEPALPAEPVACLVQDRLDRAVQRLTATGATDVRVSGRTLTAELPSGSTGTAVIAAPRITGWRCAAGDAEPAPAARRLGLLAVPLGSGADSVTCVFQPPGLRLGGAAGATALLALAGVWWLHRRGSSARRQEFTDRAPEPRSAGIGAD